MAVAFTRDISPDEFERYITEAISAVPARIRRNIRNVAFLIDAETEPTGPLLGRYQGIPLTRRSSGYSGVLPDTITIYRQPIERQAGPERQAVRRLVHRVVHHEIGHYFGFTETEVRRWEQGRRHRSGASV